MALFVMMLVMAAVIAVTAANSAAKQVWPLPWQITSGDGSVALSNDFNFFVKSQSNSILDNAVARYLTLIGSKSSKGDLTSCTIAIADANVPNEVIDADESYSIHVDSSSCVISAGGTWGALRGLETFSQLLARDNGNIIVNNLPIDISDKPRYGHRGMLIDTARHYIPLAEIKKIIDSMPTNKMNVLHWHVIDAESFPIDVPSEPTMVKGAFSPSMTYSMADITDVVSYGFARGVEVILELDVPGHAASWAAGKKEIVADCFAKYTNINNYALNPALDLTYITVQNILTDVTKAANSYKLHLGGDEVVYGCWKNDTSISTYMQGNGVKDYDAMLTSFVRRVDNNALGTSRQLNAIIHWEEVFVAKANLPKASTIYQVWTDSSMISQLTAASYRVIASPSNYWYLNLAPNTWQVVYGYEPTFNLTDTQASYIVGGEAALWGEFVDEHNIESSLYPRASAVAERLWSDPAQTNSIEAAMPRLLNQRCRLVNRGMAAAPLQPAGYCATNYI